MPSHGGQPCAGEAGWTPCRYDATSGQQTLSRKFDSNRPASTMQRNSEPPGRIQSGSELPGDGALADVRRALVASVRMQLLATLGLSAVVGLFGSWQWQLHAPVWIGAAIAIAVSVFATWRGLWRRRELRDEAHATRLLAQLYGAEFAKLLLAGLLLGLTLKQFGQLSAPLLIVGFALAYLAGVLAMAATGIVAPQTKMHKGGS